MKTLEITEEGKITTIKGIAKSGKSTILKALINKKGHTEKTHIYLAGEEDKQYISDNFTVKDIRIAETKTFTQIKMFLECVILDLVKTQPIGIIAIDAIDTIAGDHKEFMEWLEELIKGENTNIQVKSIDQVYITQQMRRTD